MHGSIKGSIIIMEQKRISEIAELKIKNANLSLEILQMQANHIMVERERVLQEEFIRLECNPEEWKLDQRTLQLINVKNGEK